MKLFQLNYNRPGPGVRKDAPPQKPFIRFFAVLGRKFFDLIKLNLLFMIPVTAACVLAWLLTLVPQVADTYITYLPFVFVSPFVAGLTIVTRNYAREEHAFIFSDFKDCVKENWKAFLINGFVYYAVMFIIGFAVRYYSSMLGKSQVNFILMVVCISILVIFISAQYYVPVMIVTFDLNLKQIYTNSLMFAIIGLWRNLLLTAVFALIAYGFYLMQSTLLTIIIGILIIIFLFFSFCMYLINFTVYPLVEKLMIKPAETESSGDEKN